MLLYSVWARGGGEVGSGGGSRSNRQPTPPSYHTVISALSPTPSLCRSSLPHMIEQSPFKSAWR